MSIFNRNKAVTKVFGVARPYGWCTTWGLEEAQPFGELAWYNVIGLLTDLCNDVTFKGRGEDFDAFNAFFTIYGEVAMHQFLEQGFMVIARTAVGFRLLEPEEYEIAVTNTGKVVISSKIEGVETYVIKSPAFLATGKSDKSLCQPALTYLDNALNASNTCSARLGSLVVASPKTDPNAPASFVLNKTQKEELEKELQTEYGNLSKQKQMMLLQRPMDFQTINLAGLDQRTMDKVRTAICMICDRLHVPANQVAMIDANSSKTLANGTELREGDFNKYQSFERLLNKTFVAFADKLGMRVDYIIYNKPTRQIGNGEEQL